MPDLTAQGRGTKVEVSQNSLYQTELATVTVMKYRTEVKKPYFIKDKVIQKILTDQMI